MAKAPNKTPAKAPAKGPASTAAQGAAQRKTAAPAGAKAAAQGSARGNAQGTGKPAAKPAGKRREPMTLLQRLAIAVFSMGVLAVALPTALMLAIGLLPAVCAYVADRNPQRHATLCVGALNIAGTWPYLLQLWTSGHSIYNAMHIVLDLNAWLIIYCAAAIGWLLYLSFPAVAAAFMGMFASHRIAQLRAEQKKLVEEWGPKIVTGASGSMPAAAPAPSSSPPRG